MESNDKITYEKMNNALVAETFHKHRQISKRELSAQYNNTAACWSFYNADQMTYTDTIQFADTYGRKRRAMVNFNEVQPNVDAVAGFMCQNRRQATAIARLNKNQGQQLYSKNCNALLEYHRGNTNADQLESDQDLEMLVCGYGAIDTEISYDIGNATTMPNGEIIKNNLDTSCVYWDPLSKDKNMIKARWAGYWQDFELKDALRLFQNSEVEDFQEVGTEDQSNTGYVFNPYGGVYDKIKMDNTVEWASPEAEMVRVFNHQWFEYETFYKAENPLYTATDPMDAMYIKLRLDFIQSKIKLPGDTKRDDIYAFDPTAETFTFDESTKRLLVKEFGQMINPISFTRKVFYTAVISGKHVFTWFKSVSQSGMSIKFKTGNWNVAKQRWEGMVNVLMEPQKYKNKALTEMMFTIAANSKGGVMIEEDVTDDVADFESKWAKTDAVMVVKSGGISGGKIQQKAVAALPTGLESVISFADQALAKNGVDPSFMGDISREDQSGVLYKRRIRQVISRFARYFDSITLYQKEDCRLLLDLLPIWVENNRGATVRMVGEDGSDEYFTLMEDKLAPEYDVDIQEASLSSDEKAETATMLSQAGFNLLTVGQVPQGMSFIAESLQFYRLDGDVRERLSKALQPPENPQIVQMQQELQKVQQYIESGQVDKTKSEAQRNYAQAAKTMKDGDISVAQVAKVQAETMNTLETAKRTSIESALAATTPRTQDNINVNL